jgi:hypothetical protein
MISVHPTDTLAKPTKETIVATITANPDSQ